MLSALILVKIAVTMAAVVGLSLLAERVSPRIAGVLAGFPHGIAIVLYFIGVEQGAEFAARAAKFAVAGLGANVVLAYCYAYFAVGRPGVKGVALAVLAALIAFAMTAGTLDFIAPPLGLACVLTLGLITLTWLLLRRWDDSFALKKPRTSVFELGARAAIAASIVVLITGLAALLGPQKAGLLAGFPVVTFPLLVILHARHGPEMAAKVVRHYPFGIVSLLVFTLTVSWGFTALGMGLGIVAGLVAASVYLAVATTLSRRAKP